MYPYFVALNKTILCLQWKNSTIYCKKYKCISGSSSSKIKNKLTFISNQRIFLTLKLYNLVDCNQQNAVNVSFPSTTCLFCHFSKISIPLMFSICNLKRGIRCAAMCSDFLYTLLQATYVRLLCSVLKSLSSYPWI